MISVVFSMKENKKSIRMKIADVMARIYGAGIAVALFAGALSFFGYFVAILIGGEMATQICEFIYKKVYPCIFTFASTIVLFGLLKMYIAGEKSMVPTKKNANKKT